MSAMRCWPLAPGGVRVSVGHAVLASHPLGCAVQGVYVGCVGARFERRGCMEWRHVMVRVRVRVRVRARVRVRVRARVRVSVSVSAAWNGATSW